MNEDFLRVAGRIRDEISEIERLVRRINDGWAQANRTGDDLYLDGVALNLHGFYGALERLFELIARATDEKIPDGANWHQLLLEKMSQEVAGVRPAVISAPIKEKLDELRGFRHVARNIYTFHIDPAKLGRLVTGVAEAIIPLIRELDAFAEFLEQEGRAK